MRQKKKGVVCIFALLFVILAVAAITDIAFGKVYNGWICLALAVGLSCAFWRGGMGKEGLAGALLSMAVPVILLYPIFRIGGMGAGDIKLLAAVGCFLTVKETVACLVLSFLAGAVLSLLKMAAERNFIRRMRYLLSYVLAVAGSGKWRRYGQEEGGKIHFALPILLGVLLYKGGMRF